MRKSKPPMNRHTTKTVDEIGELHIEGNIIPPQWFKRIRLGKNADSIAVIILGEVFYWYRPTYIRDEATGDVKEIRRKFDADKWQCSYQSLADRFGFTKRQCQDAAKRLRNAGLVTLELRNFTAGGQHLSNVLFIEPVPSEIRKITFGESPNDTAEGVLRQGVGGVTSESTTYTEIPTEIPTDNSDSKKESPASVEIQPQCGNPVSAIHSGKEGTLHCTMCATEAAKKAFDDMHSASEGMEPREHTAETSDPRKAERQFVNLYAPIFAEIVGRGEAIGEDRQAARRVFSKHFDLNRMNSRLEAYVRGEVADFKKEDATAFWIVSRLERDLAIKKVNRVRSSGRDLGQ